MLNYEPITNRNPRHEPSPSLSSGPTRSWRSLHRHRRRRPPSPSLYATAARHHHGVGCCLVPPAATVILILVVQRCRNPTNDGINAASPPFSSPPPVAVAPSPPSRSPMAPSWTGMRRRRPLVRRGECRSRPRPPFRKTGQLRQRRRQDRCDASVSSPAAGRPSLLGPPPSVGRWRRQHIDVDAHPGCLRRRDDDVRPSRQSTSSL